MNRLQQAGGARQFAAPPAQLPCAPLRSRNVTRMLLGIPDDEREAVRQRLDSAPRSEAGKIGARSAARQPARRPLTPQ
jgi:hypothetical protein